MRAVLYLAAGICGLLALNSFGNGVLGFLFAVVLAGVAVYMVIRANKSATKANPTAPATPGPRTTSIEKLLSQFGDDQDARRIGIEREFDRAERTLIFTIDYSHSTKWLLATYKSEVQATISRSIASLSPRDRNLLRAELLLCNDGIYSKSECFDVCAGLIFGDGKANIPNNTKRYYNIWHSAPYASHHTDGLRPPDSINDAVRWLLQPSTEAHADKALQHLIQAKDTHPDNPLVSALAARLLGTGQDLAAPATLATATLDAMPASFLILGGSPGSQSEFLGYSGEGSLITVAPTRSGKSQCHVIPNLLSWDGPAVVLDVKNELFKATSGWRAANVGPVFKFSPLSTKPSHRYNPISEVSDDPNSLWEDARFLADMLIVPSGSKEPFWETRARDILRAAIAHVVYFNAPAGRGMDKVLDIMHGVEWERFLSDLGTSEIPAMKRAGKSLSEMQPQMKASVLQTALTSLSCWEGTLIADATAVSHWRPADLKGPNKPTIYICLRPNEVESYISVLRVVIAQHIRRLIADDPERNPKTVLFLLDELPRLRHMPPVEEALEIGAQYGIKLWMFAQTVGQMETAYDNADGMIGGCAVRCFMNPGMQDDLAQDISEQFGFRESVVDGTRVKVVEPTTLAGPDFKDKVIVMATSATPGVLEKRAAYANETFAARMAMPPAVIEVHDVNR